MYTRLCKKSKEVSPKITATANAMARRQTKEQRIVQSDHQKPMPPRPWPSSIKSPMIEAARALVVFRARSHSATTRLRMGPPEDVESLQQALVRTLGLDHSLASCFCYREETLCAPTALGSRLAHPRKYKPFLFKAVEGSIESATSWFAMSAVGDLFPDRDSVR